MLDDKRILAVVPARGGSKGVPLKNIKPLCGEPLIVHTARLIRQIAMIDHAVVSTDSQEIAEVAMAEGLHFHASRPEELSGDRVADLPVLQHALREADEVNGVEHDVVLMLQPTSPLRKAEEIEACVEKLVRGPYDAVWTVSPADLKLHPLKLLRVENDEMRLYDEAGRKIIARQQLDPLYYRNGLCYAFTRECLLQKNTIYGDRASAVVVERKIVNIDTEEDFLRAETLMRRA